MKIILKPLTYFNAIAVWGKICNNSNTNYFIKFRFTKVKARLIVRQFRNKYPDLELCYYVTKKDMVIIGGEFHKESGVAEALVHFSHVADLTIRHAENANNHLKKELAK